MNLNKEISWYSLDDVETAYDFMQFLAKLKLASNRDQRVITRIIREFCGYCEAHEEHCECSQEKQYDWDTAYDRYKDSLME